MCTIDPTMCWYYDHIDFWNENPDLLKREVDWHKVQSEAYALQTKYILEQIASGRIKAHRFTTRKDYFQCHAEGFCRSAGPVNEDRICFNCKKGVDE